MFEPFVGDDARDGAGDDSDEATVGDLMTTPVRCVTKDISGEKLLRILLEEGISAVPVINAEGRPIGIVSKTDLLREQLRGGLPDDVATWGAGHTGAAAEEHAAQVDPLKDLTVAELMTPFAFSLPIDSPVSLACALMSYEAVHRIAVTENDGSVIGLLSSLDVMRWIAVERGYTVPPRRRKQAV
jgi:CBS domain-containing protein